MRTWKNNHGTIYADNSHESLIAEVFSEHPEHKAHALLIAAAPDLLHAAIVALVALERWGSKRGTALYGNDADQARLKLMAAIYKATGGPHA